MELNAEQVKAWWSKMPPRKRFLVGFLGVFLGGVVLYAGAYLPKSRSVESLRAEVLRTNQEFLRIQTQLSTFQPPTDGEKAGWKAQEARVAALVPKDAAFSELMERLAGLAQGATIAEIVRLSKPKPPAGAKPEAPKPQGQLDYILVKMTFMQPYEGIPRFLESLHRLPRFLEVESLTLVRNIPHPWIELILRAYARGV